MDMKKIMKQAQDFQKQLKKQQEELAGKEFEGTSGGGMVIAKVNGSAEVLSIKIDPEVIDKDEIEMLQDLIVAAVNQAMVRVQEAQQEGMSSMAGGLGLKIPGMF